MTNLRPYQVEGLNKLRTAIAGGSRYPVLVAPTGAGKTMMAVSIIQGAQEKGKKVIMFAPRRELIYQASERLEAHDIDYGVVMAGCLYLRKPILVASFDTVHARAVQSERIALPPADIVIVDEAHLSISNTRKHIIQQYKNKGAIVIGLTATPARGDGRGLGEIYDDLVETVTIRSLIDQGFLAPIRYFASTAPVDLNDVPLNKDGDYVEKQLAKRVDKQALIGDIVSNWLRIAPDRQTVVFAVNRAHSRHICDEFLRAGIKAEHLDGETELEERAGILKRMNTGETQVLCNVFVATYGLDIPILSCCVFARPSKNIALYLQMAGRVLRVHKDVPDAIMIDHAGAIQENGFVEEEQPWTLDGNDTVKERKQKEKEKNKEPIEMTCGSCGYVFKAERTCPRCGHEILQKREAIPCHEEDLQEIVVEGKTANRKTDWKEKVDFMREMVYHAKKKGFKKGWAQYQYKQKFGVWGNDPRVKDVAPAKELTSIGKGWLAHVAIKNAHKRKK